MTKNNNILLLAVLGFVLLVVVVEEVILHTVGPNLYMIVPLLIVQLILLLGVIARLTRAAHSDRPDR